MRRKKLKVQFPNGYPYVLLSVANKKSTKVVVATSENQAMKIANIKGPARIIPLMVIDLIKNEGHAAANAFLKEFGDSWMCKEGRIFFKELV